MTEWSSLPLAGAGLCWQGRSGGCSAARLTPDVCRQHQAQHAARPVPCRAQVPGLLPAGGLHQPRGGLHARQERAQHAAQEHRGRESPWAGRRLVGKAANAPHQLAGNGGAQLRRPGAPSRSRRCSSARFAGGRSATPLRTGPTAPAASSGERPGWVAPLPRRRSTHTPAGACQAVDQRSDGKADSQERRCPSHTRVRNAGPAASSRTRPRPTSRPGSSPSPSPSPRPTLSAAAWPSARPFTSTPSSR